MRAEQGQDTFLLGVFTGHSSRWLGMFATPGESDLIATRMQESADGTGATLS